MFTINYHTGAGNESFDTIEECKVNVNPAYTQQDITIDDEDGGKLYISRWWGTAYDPEEDENEPLARFGDFGYYGDWVEIV